MTKNGYSLSRAWFDWAWDNPDKVRTIHHALYMWYVEKWNRVGQKEKFSITTSECMDILSINSRNTYSKALNDLIDFGFVTMIKKSRNQNSCNVIALAQKINKQEDSKRTALDKAMIQQEDSTYTINKQDNKETKNKGTIEQRRDGFRVLLNNSFPNENKQRLETFFLYWSEYSPGDKKMRWEKQDAFNLSRRMGTWKKNEKPGEYQESKPTYISTLSESDKQW